MDIIKARSEVSLKLALRQQQGQLSKEIGLLRKRLLDIIVNLEAVIDYPEEDIEEVTFLNVKSTIYDVQSEISLRLGYSSIHYFSKSFNMKYHMSPSEFVKQNCQSSV